MLETVYYVPGLMILDMWMWPVFPIYEGQLHQTQWMMSVPDTQLVSITFFQTGE